MHESLGQQSFQPTRTLDVVQDYLDSLLRDVSLAVSETDAEITPENLQIAPVLTERDTSLMSDSVTISPPPIETVRVIPSPESVVPVIPAAAPLVTAKLVRSAAKERDIPDWGQQGFAALLFEVAGIKMATPLHSLGGISLIGNNLQTVAAQADWFMGLLRWNNRNLRVVDTAKFIMPERIKDDSHRLSYQSVIVLGDSHWALAVDQAEESTHLNAEDVRWKHLLGTRPWLAGTLLNQLCALMDAECLLSLLIEADNTPATGTKTQ